MSPQNRNPYSAAEPGLGYIYQGRFALLHILSLPEESGVLIEMDDDLDFVDVDGQKSLASLKHKRAGERVTDLSVDFWKSVRIWLASYLREGGISSKLRFFLFTTASVSPSSFLRFLVPEAERPTDPLHVMAASALRETTSETILPIREQFEGLKAHEQEDFLSRISIMDNSPRITQIPSLAIDSHLRTIRREFRGAVFERLEGWWFNLVIKALSGERTGPIFGYEVSDKLSAISEEYQSNNLPITFRNRVPDGGVDAETDKRLFVAQLRAINISPSRLRNAILDYYRAFEQRSSWARENLLVSGEVEDYEDRLVEEWGRFRDVLFEDLTLDSAEDAMIEAGKALYNWAELETAQLRIRERVDEPYVVRGAFHMLANVQPTPRVYWHPRFLERLASIFEVTDEAVG
jgi:hypothetical protein